MKSRRTLWIMALFASIALTNVLTAVAQAQVPEVPYVSTPDKVVEEMLRLASVGKNDVVYDLGCGDGRIVITAAQKYGASGVGVDVDPERIRESNENARKAGVTDRVKFLQQDLFETDLSQATVVTLYLLPDVNLRLRPKLLRELKPGTRIVSHAFDMGDWKPEKAVKVPGADRERTIYYWVVPSGPSRGGNQTQEEKPYGLRALLDGSGFARIPAGEFLMGSSDGSDDERPAHRVRIGQGFEMGKFEVTQAQWEAVMSSKRDAHAKPAKGARAPGEAMTSRNPSHFQGATLPMENVSWDDVQQFLRALNALDGKHLYRLPTEGEWEYACRAGTKVDDAEDLDAITWYEANSKGQTQPVGQKKPNAWGLYDTQGNVWEWVQDWYGHDYYKHSLATDPQGPESGSYRVYRGGSWHSADKDCRPAMRGFDLPNNHYYSLGFRLVRTAK